MNKTEYKEMIGSQIQIFEDLHGSMQPQKQLASISKRTQLRLGIKPELDIANNTMSSIYKAFTDNCNGYKKYKDMKKQIKNWEKQLRGACEQIIMIVNVMQFDAENEKQCSPMAWHKIQEYNSRDRSCLDMCAAIMVFYNSLSDEKPKFLEQE